ncbi:MAG: molybdopterin-dependent oxidoreductase [Ardenticatenaceae bacterium]|nr:molybdopterin-dependent oxidoreductase [Ardenticatenaceae bacterium]
MIFPWANLSLIIFLATLIITGFFGLKSGFGGNAWLLWLHGVAAYGLIVLMFWKAWVIMDAWRRKKRWTRQRISFAVMLLMLLGVLALGLMWTFQGPIYWYGFSLVSLHIYLAVPLMILIVWHGWRMKFIFKVEGAADRRLFLGTAGSAILGLGLGAAASRVQKKVNLASVQQRFTGSYLWPSSKFPVTSWIFDYPPPINIDEWRLTISGAVDHPLSWRYADLHDLPSISQDALLDCTSGWYTEQKWRGVPLQAILEAAGVQEDARSVTVRAVSGYQRRFKLEEAAGFLLALEVADAPLSHGHGFPVRLVAPPRRGFEWVKWVSHIEVNKTSAFWQSPLPLR